MFRSLSRLPRHRLIKGLQLLMVIGVICLGMIWGAAGMAQTDLEEPQSADIVLDGRVLFQISGNDNTLATERADDINRKLQEAVESGEFPRLRVENQEGRPVEIYLNDSGLMSIRPGDIETPGLSSEEQARAWVGEIREAIRQAQQERSLFSRWKAIFISIGAGLIAIGLHWLLRRLRQRLPEFTRRALSSRGFLDEHQLQTLERLETIVILLFQGFVSIVTLSFITDQFPRTRQIHYFIRDTLLSGLTTPFLSVGSQSYSFVDFLILFALIFGLILLSGVITNILRARVLQVAGLRRGVQEAIAVSVRYGFITLGLVVVLQAWGLDLSSLTILASSIALGVGFGFQNIARNLSSGLVLLFERPIQVGDFVEVGDYVGTVEHIGARRTLIRTLDQISIIVPNSRFLEEEVINWSHQNPISRLHLPVGVSYHSDVDQVRSALLEATKGQDEVLPIPPPSVLFKGFGDSALDFELLVWIRDPSRQPVIKSDLYFLIWATLKQHQIEIPFPQRDLHMRSGTLPLQFPPQLERSLAQVLSRIGGEDPDPGSMNGNTQHHRGSEDQWEAAEEA